MPSKICSLAAMAAAATMIAAVPAWAQSQPAAGQVPGMLPGVIILASCDAGDRIDGTTAAQTKKKIEAAGYKQVRDLTKGCDNYWHAAVIGKDGMPGNVVVTPEGQVKPEGN